MLESGIVRKYTLVLGGLTSVQMMDSQKRKKLI